MPSLHRLRATLLFSLRTYIGIGIAVPLYLYGQFWWCEQKHKTPQSWSIKSRLDFHGARLWAEKEDWGSMIPAYENLLSTEQGHTDQSSILAFCIIYTDLARAGLQLKSQDTVNYLLQASKKLSMATDNDWNLNKDKAFIDLFTVAAQLFEIHKDYVTATQLYAMAFAKATATLQRDNVQVDRLLGKVTSTDSSAAFKDLKLCEKLTRDLQEFGKVESLKIMTVLPEFALKSVDMIKSVAADSHTSYSPLIFQCGFGLARSIHQICIKRPKFSPTELLFSTELTEIQRLDAFQGKIRQNYLDFAFKVYKSLLEARQGSTETISPCLIAALQLSLAMLIRDAPNEAQWDLALNLCNLAFTNAQKSQTWIDTNLKGKKRQTRELKMCATCSTQALRLIADMESRNLNPSQRENLLKEAYRIANTFNLLRVTEEIQNDLINLLTLT